MTDKLLRRNLAQLNQNSKNQSFESNLQCCLSLMWSTIWRLQNYQFTFNHYFLRSSWYSFNQPQKDERLSWPLSSLLFSSKVNSAFHLGKNDRKWSKMIQDMVSGLFNKITALILSRICVKWKFLWFINILWKLHAWEKSGACSKLCFCSKNFYRFYAMKGANR